MDSQTRAKVKALPSLEVTDDLARRVANHPGLVVLTLQGEPIGAAVGLEDLLFILDARAAEAEDALRSVQEPSSGPHQGAKRKDH